MTEAASRVPVLRATSGRNRATTAKKNSAVPSSTSGYRMEIGAAQARQRPRSTSHDSTGTLSVARMCVPHAVQALGGKAMDRPMGTRYTTTFRNDPMSDPKRPTATATVNPRSRC